MSAGFYDCDCPGYFRKCLELHQDGRVIGGTKDLKSWRMATYRLGQAIGARVVSRLEILDSDNIIFYQFEPDSQGWRADWAGLSVYLRPLPKPVIELGGYDGPKGPGAA